MAGGAKKDQVKASATARKNAEKAAAPDSTGGDAAQEVAVAATAPPAVSKALTKSKFCINCQKDLTRNIRITCAECFSPTTSLPLIELCVECFGVGVELGGHKKTHKYTVSDCLAFPIVRERGTVSGDASASITATVSNDVNKEASGLSGSSDWTADEELLLLEGIEMFGMGNWKDIAEHVQTKNERKCEAHYLSAYLARRDLLPAFIDDPEDPADAQPQDTAAGFKSGELLPAPTPLSDRPSGSELAGYMPLRGDFDVEYENEAELILADMEFSEDDHPTERELKLKVIEIYNAKLDERERRKKFVIERGLLDYKKHQQSERRRPKDEREIIAQMRPFARFQTPAEHEEFVNGLITAMRLRKQILLLQEYRKNGVRTLAEAELYDAEKKKRETEQALQKQRESASYLYDSARPQSGGRDRASRWLSRDGSSGQDTTDDQSRSRASTSFDVDGTPGSHLLAPKEKELCAKLKLLPKHYLVIKDALVRECYRLGYLTEKTAQDIVKIDVNRTGQIYDFFVSCGWVRTEANTSQIAVPARSKPDTTSNPATSGVAEVTKDASSAANGAALTTNSSKPATPSKRKADEITPDSASISS